MSNSSSILRVFENRNQVWDVGTQNWVAMQQPILEAGSVTIPGIVTVSDGGGSLTIDGIPELKNTVALSATGFNLQAAPYSASTGLTTDYILNRASIQFSTAAARTITVSDDSGSILYTVVNDTSLEILIDFEDDAHAANDNITVAVTQTGAACALTLRVLAYTGAVSPPAPNNFTFDAEGRLETTVSGIPPVQVADKRVLFSQFLTSDGTAGGSNDLRVNGSAVPVDFWIPAHATRDRYLSSLFFVLADVNAVANKFGNITELTNGCQLIYSRADVGEVALQPPIKTSFDIIRLCGANPAFGDGNTAFRLNNAVGTSEGYIQTLDFNQMHGFLYGLRLRAGTSTKVILRVNDDITGVDGFTIRATGFERLPD
jgi:hypothetical protein